MLKKKKEPDLDLKISNLEIKDITIPFQKISATDCPPIKLTFYNTMIKKNEEIEFYNYFQHLQKFGFVWEYSLLRTVLHSLLLGVNQTLFYQNKVERIFVPKFYRDKRDTNFLKFLSYVGEYGPDNSRCEFPQIGRKYYEYKKSPPVSLSRAIQPNDLDWPFPQTYFKNIGLTVRGFNFFCPNLSTSLKNFFQPSQKLLNIESGTEEASTVPTQYSFYPTQQQIEENIKNIIMFQQKTL